MMLTNDGQDVSVDTSFAQRIIAWQRIHGRHDLPWQSTRDPYAIWVSEIMLQQTQVAAVVGYYDKFMRRFPDIASLARAGQETVLQYWSGLGYYSRARNLQRSARIIMEIHGGQFPTDFSLIQTLPGIGRSTAAAIASLAFDQPQPILDGNAKRVFARHFLVAGWPGLSVVEKQLWQIAENLMPQQAAATYTQGLMDLGATVCTRSRPRCGTCPVQSTCAALLHDSVSTLPSPKPRKAIPVKTVTMLLLLRGDEVLLEKRPPSGIWGGLWSLPEAAATEDLRAIASERYGLRAELLEALPLLTHTFTHFRLQITPQPLTVSGHVSLAKQDATAFFGRSAAIAAALPSPIRKILQSLGNGCTQSRLKQTPIL